MRIPRWVWLSALVCGALSLVSLVVLPSALVNDPNWWLVWARELPSGTISLVGQGNVSWKPLPVLVSAPFTAVSDAIGIHFWLWLSRACALGTMVLLYRLAARRGGMVGGLVAAALPFLILNWDQSLVGGASEPVLMVLILGAVEAGLAGRRHLALWLGVFAGIIRPEVSPLLGIYGVWLLRREGKRALIGLGAGVLVLAIGWFVLPGVLMGDPLQAATTTTVFPGPKHWIGGLFWIAIGWPQTFWWTLIPLAAGVFVAVRERDSLLLWLLGGAAIWTLTLVLLGAGGVAGMPRYTVPPMIVLCVVAGAGAGAIVMACRPTALKVCVAGVLFIALGWSCGLHARQIKLFFNLGRETQLAVDGAAAAVKAAGGKARLAGCEPLATHVHLGYPGPLGPRLGMNVRGRLKPASAPTVMIVGKFGGLRLDAAGKPPKPAGETGRRVLATVGDWSVVYVAGKTNCGGFTATSASGSHTGSSSP